MREINNISSELFDKIRTRFDNVRLGDEKSKATTDPEQARFFNFDYTVDGEKVGVITISLIDESSLKLYYGRDIVTKIKQIDAEREEPPSEGVDDETKWYNFLRSIRQFAKRNLLTFDTRDITKSNLQTKDVKQQTQADDTIDAEEMNVTEGRMFGTSRSSYQECGPVRIIVRHSGEVDEAKRGSRTRNIESVFLETHLGERFLLPFNNLHGARAMAQHCSQGGSVHDELGEGICGMVEEMNAMRHFVRSVGRRQFEDADTTSMAHSAVQHYNELKNRLRHIGGHRGYGDYKDTYTPVNEIADDVDINGLRERFVKKIYDEKFDAALPYVYRAHMKQKESLESPMGNQFEDWANQVVEGSWALPDTPEETKDLDELMANRLEVGNNGENATGALYNIIGDDDLFDKLEDLASAEGPDSDARPTIVHWLRDNSYTELANKYDQLFTQDDTALQQQEPALAAQQQQAGAGEFGGVGTAEPSPAQRPEMQESRDELSWMRRLAGLK
jgi:hypothetical protein